ncbi:hypothetical protein [Candidatus Nitrospira bockiana]
MLVAWPAFWTGFPIKLVIALLLLAMGIHPWEAAGLAFLMILSIPVDIWALNVASKTVFLERLRLKAPDSIGLTLWWQGALMSAFYLPILYVVEAQTVGLSKAIAAWVMEFLKEIPVAERIGIELTLWGTPSTIMLVLLILGWLFLFGTLVKRQATGATPAEGSLQTAVRQWDLMRVPADQPLVLTTFTAVGVMIVILFWAFMPVTTPHPHESYHKDVAKATPSFKPVEALQKTEKVIAQAEAAVQALEEKATTEKDEKGKGKGAAKEGKEPGLKEAAKPPADAAKSGKAQVASEKPDAHAADGHKH